MLLLTKAGLSLHRTAAAAIGQSGMAQTGSREQRTAATVGAVEHHLTLLLLLSPHPYRPIDGAGDEVGAIHLDGPDFITMRSENTLASPVVATIALKAVHNLILRLPSLLLYYHPTTATLTQPPLLLSLLKLLALFSSTNKNNARVLTNCSCSKSEQSSHLRR